MSANKILRCWVAVTTALLLFTASVQAQTESVLKVVLDGEVNILDPIASTNYRTRDLAYMVFDMLIAMDSKGNYKPQMLESWTISPDGMKYNFKLRPGLEFSDGAPVTAQDCVASIERWGKRDAMGKQLMASLKALTVIDSQNFTLELAKPYGYVIEALGKPSSNVLAIMPARLAATEPTKQVSELIGSGPFVFRKDLWVPGSRMVLDKNPKYKPRPEPADGLAGGKRALVDRIELLVIPDSATRVSALQTGEIDFLHQVPFDFVPILREAKGVSLDIGHGLASYMLAARPNHLQPPFNNLKIRQALQALMDQHAMLAALGAPPELVKECQSMFMCDAPYTSTAGTQNLKRPDIERAKALMKEGGYKGEPVVVLHATDILTIHLFATVLEDSMRKAGFNVVVRASDWATVAQRRFSKEPLDKGGWSLMPLQWVGFDLGTPLTHYGIAYNCTDGYAGWSCDKETTRLMAQFIAETNQGKRQALADQIQQRAHETVSVVLGGQFTFANAYRSNLKGVLSVGIPVFWNIQK